MHDISEDVLHCVIDYLPISHYFIVGLVSKHWNHILNQNASYCVAEFLHQKFVLQPFSFSTSFPSHTFITKQLQTRFSHKHPNSITMSLKRLEFSFQNLQHEEKKLFSQQMELIKPFLRHCYWSMDAMLYTELPIVKEQVQFYKTLEYFFQCHPNGHQQFVSFFSTLFSNYAPYFLMPSDSGKSISFEDMLQQVNFLLFTSSNLSQRRVTWKMEDEMIVRYMACSAGLVMNIVDCSFYLKTPIALQMVQYVPSFVDESLWSSKEFVLQAIPILSATDWNYIEEDLFKDVDIVRALLRTKKVTSMKKLDVWSRSCPTILAEATQLIPYCGLLLHHLPTKQWTREMVLTAVKQNGHAIRFIANQPIYFNDLQVNLDALYQTMYCLPFVNSKLITEEMVLEVAAFHRKESHTKFQTRKIHKLPFTGNVEFILKMIQVSPHMAPYFLDDELMLNEQIAVAFALRKPKLLSHFAVEVRNSSNVQQALLQSNDSHALEYLSPSNTVELNQKLMHLFYKQPYYLHILNPKLTNCPTHVTFLKTILQIDGSLYVPLQQQYPNLFCEEDVSLAIFSLEHVNGKLSNSTVLLYEHQNNEQIISIYAKHDLNMLQHIDLTHVERCVTLMKQVSPYCYLYFAKSIRQQSVIKELLVAMEKETKLPWTSIAAK